MKKKSVCRLLLVLSFISFNFYGCQKEISNQNGSTNLTVAALSSKVNNWLNKQQAKYSAGRKDKMQQLQQNLDFEKLHIEALNEREQLIIVPVKNEYKTVNNKDKSVSNIAVFILDRAGEIRQGNVLQYASASTDSDNSFPDNTITKVYNNQKITSSGKFTLLSVYDKFEYELTYHAGSLQATGYMQPKTSASGRSGICLAWYLVTTTFYSDGTQETTETFLGTTCYESGCYPSDPNLQSLDCLEPGSGDAGDAVVLLTSLVNVDTVANQLTDSCLKAIVNQITDARLRNEISKLFNQTYIGIGYSVNFKLIQVSNLLDRNGNPQVAQSWLLGAANEWGVKLNASFTGTSAKEFIGLGVLHEIVHSFVQLYQTNTNEILTDSSSHEIIFSRWVNQMRDGMIEIFGMSTTDATALALQGMDDILSAEDASGNFYFRNSYNQLALNNYGMSLNTARGIRDQYEAGTKGTRCQ
jgi:hypothetical protein